MKPLIPYITTDNRLTSSTLGDDTLRLCNCSPSYKWLFSTFNSALNGMEKKNEHQPK